MADYQTVRPPEVSSFARGFHSTAGGYDGMDFHRPCMLFKVSPEVPKY